MSCNICCENFNKSNHSKIICPYNDCNFESCKKCIRTYILNTTNEPHCMNCKNAYDQEFLIKNLNKSFIENDYKNHRKTLLVEKEISKTQELMPMVSKTIEIEEHTKVLNKYMDERKELRNKLNNLDTQIRDINRSINNLKNSDVENERKQFIMPCPADNCKGYLSNKYKCGICNLYTCPDCLEVIGYNKHEEHICNPDSVKSTEAIKRETKPCPKCGVRIFKIIGCDQMWCTECKVTFSWNNGKIIITNNIHNPHYYEYMKNQNNNDNTRNPGDILCGGLIRYNELILISRSITNNNLKIDMNYIYNKYKNTIYSNNNIIGNLISNIHRIMVHFNNIELINLRHTVTRLTQHDDNTIKYIRNLITKDELASLILKADNIKRKSNKILHIYELISIISIEGFNSIYNKCIEYSKHFKFMKSRDNIEKDYNNLYDECVKFIEQFNYIINYSNLQLANISYNYNLSVLQVEICYNINYVIKENIIDFYKIKKVRFNKSNIKELEEYCNNFKYLETSKAGPSSIN